MRALEVIADWPVPNAAASVVAANGDTLGAFGDTARPFHLASLSKMLTAWATLIAVEEGLIDLAEPIGQPGCTLRHLLSHAGGYAFDGPDPVATPEVRRIYSNTGIELAAAAVAERADMPFADYLAGAVFEPLGMTSTRLRGSAAHGAWASAADVGRFLGELQRPALVSPATAADAVHPQYPQLAGIVPGVGRFDPCPWGLGFEIRGAKTPHWTGHHNDPTTYGHFGGAGTMAWVDPQVGVGLVALTDRGFDQWSVEAMRCWPALSDTVVAEVVEAT